MWLCLLQVCSKVAPGISHSTGGVPDAASDVCLCGGGGGRGWGNRVLKFPLPVPVTTAGPHPLVVSPGQGSAFFLQKTNTFINSIS